MLVTFVYSVGHDEPGVLRHVLDEALEEVVLLQRRGVADDGQVAPSTSYGHVQATIFR